MGVAAAAVVIAVAGALISLSRSGGDGPDGDGSSDARPETVVVTSGSVVDTTEVRGTLKFADDGAVTAGSSGVVTSLPAPGRKIKAGKVLYTIDTRPVVLMSGQLPAWRDLRVGVPAGQDIRQLERGLAALGWFDLAPDDRFTSATAASVRAWQRDLGVDQTGAVERSAIMFAEHSLRVASTSVTKGADVASGAELYTTTSSRKVVSVDLGLDDQQLAVPDASVTVVLPDGTELPASVRRVGEAVERQPSDGADQGKIVVPVTIGLTVEEDAARFARAEVTVRFTSTLGEDLLTVPVDALVATGADSYGVEVPGSDPGKSTVKPVSVGAFASGRVVISGPGIVAGLRVTVPTS